MKPSSAIHDSAVDTLCEVFLDKGYVPIREGTLMNIESGWWWLDKTLSQTQIRSPTSTLTLTHTLTQRAHTHKQKNDITIIARAKYINHENS
jgi:hypothetical protein